MRTFVLDSGAFIAIERRDRRMIAALAAAAELDVNVVVPATVLAEIWRQPPHHDVARLIKAATIVSLDEDSAKRTGTRLGRGGTMVDANVVEVATLVAPSRIATSDPHDIAALIPHGSTIELLDLQ